MTAAALLLGAVTAERIAELCLARRNTAALLAKGAIEFAPGHYPAIVLLHGLWLASLWVFGVTHLLDSIWLAIFLSLQVLRVWTSDHAWPSVDHSHHHPSGRCARIEWPLPHFLASKLPRRCWRDCHSAALPRPTLACCSLLRSKCDPPSDPGPCRECRADRVPQCRTRLSTIPGGGLHVDRLCNDVRRHVHGDPRRAGRGNLIADDFRARSTFRPTR